MPRVSINPAEKLSKHDIGNGKQYVKADREVIFGNNPNEWARQITNYINREIRKGHNVTVYAADGDALTITRDTAGKAQFRNKINVPGGKSRLMVDSEYAVKLRAEAHIDELAEISKRGPRTIPDKGNHKFAPDGFNYRTAYFMDDTGYYRLTISVGKNGGINTVYNVGKIKEAEFPRLFVAQRPEKNSTSNDISIASKPTSVNNSIRDGDAEDAPRFSLKDTPPVDTQKLTEYLPGDVIAKVKGQIFEAKTHNVTSPSLDAVAKRLLAEMKSAYDASSFKGELRELFDFLGRVRSNGPEEIDTSVLDAASGLMRKALETSSAIDAELYKHYSDVRDYLKKTPIRLTDIQRSEAAYLADNYREYRNALSGSTRLVGKDGIGLDTAWKELSSMHPELFDPEAVEGDMPAQLMEAVQSIKPRYINPYGFDMDGAAFDYTLRMFDLYYNLPEVRRMRKEVQSAAQARYESRLKLYKREEISKRQEISKKYNEAKTKQHLEDMVHFREQYRKLSSRYNEKLMEQRAAHQEWKAADRVHRQEHDSMTRYRKRIENNAKTLYSWLAHPTDAKHVPEALRNTVSDFLLTVDFAGGKDTKRAAKWRERMLALTGFMAKVDAADVAENADIFMDIDGGFIGQLEEFIKKTDDVYMVSELNGEQLRELDYLLGILKRAVMQANTIIIDGKRQTIKDFGEAVISKADKKGPKYTSRMDNSAFGRLLSSGSIKPAYFFKNIGGSIQKLFDGVREGQNRYAFNMAKSKDFYDAAVKKYHANLWLNRKGDALAFTSQRGDKIEFTRQQALSIYATAKREAANTDTGAKHLTAGGFVYEAERTIEAKGKLGQKKTYTFKDAKPKPLSEVDLVCVVKWLTAEQKAFADALVRYMSTTLAALGNETSLLQVGYKKFLEGYYFPYKSSRDFLQSEPGKGQDSQRWKHKGFTKKTVAGANNPVVLQDFTAVFGNHVNEMLMYNAMSIPQENLLRVYNYKTPVAEEATSTSVKAALQNAYGEAAKRYIDTFLADLNGSVVVDPRESLAASLISKFKKGAVLASLSVSIQQPSSIIRAMALVDPKYFVTKPQKDSYAEAKRYAGTAVIKEIGGFDTGTGRGAAEWLTAVAPDNFNAKAKELVAADGKYRDSLLGWLPGKMDEITWGHIWGAVKNEIAATASLKPGSEEFLQAAGKRFNDVIEYTQVYDSVITRSELMRSKSGAAQMATAFMAEPTVSYNMLYDALTHAGDKGYKGKVSVGRALSAFVGSIVFNSILRSVVYAMWDDDKDQAFIEKYVEALAGSLMGRPLKKIPYVGNNAAIKFLFSSDLSPFMLVPYARDIMSIFQGYNIDRTDMALFGDLANAVDNLDSDKKTSYEKLRGLAGVIAALFGLPVKNVWRDVEAVYNTAMQAFAGGDTTSLHGLLNAVKKGTGIDNDISSNIEALHKAHFGGDEKRRGEILDEISEQYLGDVEAKIKNGMSRADAQKETKSSLLRSCTSVLKPLYQAAPTATEKMEIRSLALRIRIGNRQLYRDYDFKQHWDR